MANIRTSLLAWLRRHRWGCGIAAVVFALYAGVSATLLPPWVRGMAVDYVENTLKLRLTLGEVSYNPFTLSVSVRDAALQERDGTPLASWRNLRVNVELWGSLLRRGLSLKEVELDAPRVQAVLRTNGELNLARLVPEPKDKAEESDAAMPRVHIGRVIVRQGRATWEDRSRGKPYRLALGPIDFSLDDFQTTPGHESTYHLALQVAGQGRVRWDGEFSLQPLASHGKFQLSDVSLVALAQALHEARPEWLPVALQAGLLDLQGRYDLRLDPALQLKVDLQDAAVRDLAVATGDASSVAAAAPITPTHVEPAPAAVSGSAVDAAAATPLPVPAATLTPPWMRLTELRLSQARMSLAEASLDVQAVSVKGLQLRVQREKNGALQPWQGLQDALRTAAQQASVQAKASAQNSPPSKARPKATARKKSPAPTAPATWRVGVKDFALGDAQLDFTDLSTEAPLLWTLAPISASLKDLRTDTPRADLPLQVSVGAWKGSVTAEGKAQLEPLGAQLNVALQDLDLTALQPYVTQWSSLDLLSAQLGGQLQVRYNSAGAPRLSLRGDAQLRKVETRDHELSQPLLGWQLLQLNGLEFQQAPDRWKIDQIRLSRPYARVAMAANGSLNVTRALRRPAPGPTPASAQESKPTMPGQIREILIEDGTADFSDQSLKPTFAAGIYQLRGSVTGLSTEQISRAQVRLDGSVDRYAPVTIAGDLNVLASVRSSDLRLRFANMDLTTFNPYATKYVGYPIERGKLTTELRYQLKDRQLDAQHRVKLDQLTFGAANDSKDAVSLPVKLAVAVLQDSRGVIEIDLPVTGSLDDPDFRFGPLVWQALEGLLRRVVTAPFAMLGALFESDDELQIVEFSPGVSELESAQLTKLDKLVQALKERPLLRLNVPLGVSDERDDVPLAQKSLDEALPASSADPQARLAALTALYARKTGAAPQWPADQGEDRTQARITWLSQQLLPRFAATAGDRDALARARAETVRRRLIEVGQVSAERIFLVTEGAMAVEGSKVVRMELKLD